MDPLYEVGQTVYFEDDPEPGEVKEIEPQGQTFRYRVKFQDQPEEWPGYWYTEAALSAEPEPA